MSVSARPPRDLTLISTTLFLWGLGEGMFTYFQPIYLKQWGASPVWIGLILSGMGVWMTIAHIPAGYLADRFGPRSGMRAAWFLGTIAAIVMAAATTLPLFVTGMFLYGLTTFVAAPLNAYLTASRGEWSIERALTVPNALYNSGMVAGAVLGGAVASAFGIQRIYACSAILFAFSTSVLFLARPAPREAHHSVSEAHPKLHQNPRFLGLLGVIFVTMFALYLPQPLTPNYLATQASLPYQTIGLLGAVGSLGNAVISFGLRGLAAPVSFIIGQVFVGLYALFLWQGQGVAWYAVGYFFIGGYRLTRSMTLAYARRFVRPSETGLAYGVVETVTNASIIFAPFAAGLLYSANPRSVYAVSLAAIGMVVLINLGLRKIAKT